MWSRIQVAQLDLLLREKKKLRQVTEFLIFGHSELRRSDLDESRGLGFEEAPKLTEGNADHTSPQHVPR